MTTDQSRLDVLAKVAHRRGQHTRALERLSDVSTQDALTVARYVLLPTEGHESGV